MKWKNKKLDYNRRDKGNMNGSKKVLDDKEKNWRRKKKKKKKIEQEMDN